MTEHEARHECPVCLGIKLQKLQLSPELLLDHCERCGGMWFDASEIPALRRAEPRVLATRIVLQESAHLMKCHSCLASMPVDSLRCPTCREPRVLACPTCGDDLSHHERFDIDVCRACRGAWFDNLELARIWNGQLDALIAKERSRGRPHGGGAFEASDAAGLVLEVLVHSPDVAVHVAGAAAGAARLVGSAGQAVLQSPDAAASAIEGGVSFAGAVFEVIAEVLGGL